jgi:hypothetical protein
VFYYWWCHILSKEERKSFKNVHWLLRQRRADLNADERRMLNRLFRYSPKLALFISSAKAWG